jgi:Uma2 family endonuclease
MNDLPRLLTCHASFGLRYPEYDAGGMENVRAELPKRLFTVDEFYRMAEVGILEPDARLELLEGEIVEMSPVGVRHVACVNRANALFSKHFGDRTIVSVQNPVQLSEYTEPQPDIVMLKPRADYYAGKKISWDDALLVIEVSDTTIRRDRYKLSLYAKAGVSELWIEDLRHETIFVYRDPRPGTYGTTLEFHRGDQISLLAFPDVTFSVEDLIG